MIRKFLKQNIKQNFKNYLTVISVSIILTLLMSVVAPFLVRNIIDENVLTNSRWQQTTQTTNVMFQNKYYKKVNNDEGVLLTKENTVYFLGDKQLTSKEAEPFLNYIFNNTIKIMALFFVSFILAAFLSYLADYNLRLIARKTIKEMRNEALIIILKLNISYYDKNSDGEIITKIINDTQTFYRLLIDIGTVVINSTIVYASITITMAFINIYLFFIALLLLPVTLIWMRFYIKKVVHAFERERDSMAKMNSLTNEQIHGIDLIKTFQYEQQAEVIFEKQAQQYFNSAKTALIAEATIGWTLVTLLQRSFALLIILYFGISFINHSEILISAGFIFLIIQFMNSITYPLIELIHMLNAYNTVMVSLRRLTDFLQLPLTEDSNNNIVVEKGEISFKDVDFAYDKQTVLNKLSIDFKKQAKNAIVGSTGSGKSTIISLIMRFYDRQSGKIIVDNQDINNFSKQSLRDNIGLVLQKTYLFEGSIYDNIVLDGNYSEAEVLKLAEIAKADFIYNHPQGLQQRISESSNNISLGQKQIIALLRALIKKPKIVILDEASSNLDMESEQAINNLIDYYSKDATIIIVAHRIATIASCDQIYVIDNGKLVEQGDHNQLMQAQGAYFNNIKSLKG